MARRIGLPIDAERREPIYQQIFEGIAARIRGGTFPPGHRLPPTRRLADELGAHRNTVVRAYENLEAAGFVTSTVGRGTFVAPARGATREVPAPREVREPSGIPWAALVARSASAEPLSRFDRLQANLAALSRVTPFTSRDSNRSGSLA